MGCDESSKGVHFGKSEHIQTHAKALLFSFLLFFPLRIAIVRYGQAKRMRAPYGIIPRTAKIWRNYKHSPVLEHGGYGGTVVQENKRLDFDLKEILGTQRGPRDREGTVVYRVSGLSISGIMGCDLGIPVFRGLRFLRCSPRPALYRQNSYGTVECSNKKILSTSDMLL